jgi:hypothetical protein
MRRKKVVECKGFVQKINLIPTKVLNKDPSFFWHQGNSDLLCQHSERLQGNKQHQTSRIDTPLELTLPHSSLLTLDCHENHGLSHDLGEEEGEEEAPQSYDDGMGDEWMFYTETVIWQVSLVFLDDELGCSLLIIVSQKHETDPANLELFHLFKPCIFYQLRRLEWFHQGKKHFKTLLSSFRSKTVSKF